MKKRNTKNTTKLALCAGAAALAALAPQAHAQSSDALIDKLVDKGILTTDEAKDLRVQSDNDFRTALAAKSGMPDWVTSYKVYGDFRARYDQVSSTQNNTHFVERDRYRFRLRAGLIISMQDNLEVGFSITSGDSAPTTGGYSNGGGNPNSNNSTMQDNGTKKNVYIDTAYGKWTPLNSDGWLLSATFGKMYNPLQFTPMVFDNDWTPEGVALQSGYTFNDQHTLLVNGAAFVEDQEVGGGNTGSVQAPALFAGQVIWNANWTQKFGTSLGLGGYLLSNSQNLTNSTVPYVNQGNSRMATSKGQLINGYAPLIADVSATYKLDSFPMYPGAFPIKVAGEYINNVDAVSGNNNNQGVWAGITLGKSGTKKTWDLIYRYEYLEADATYDQLVDDDNGAYYQHAPNGGAAGWYGGTNIKGHLIKADYSFTDALTLSFTCYINDLIAPGLNTPAGANHGEPKNGATHLMADLMWKF